MFESLLGKKKDIKSQEQTKHREIVEKISKMNLTDMRSYVKNSIKGFEVCEEGLIEVMKKLTSLDEVSSKLYVHSDDMDSKKKKAFDLVLLVGASKKVTLELVELLQKFMEVYGDMIAVYDKEYKEIYASRLADSLTIAISNVDKLSKLHNKMKVLGEE